MMVMMIMVMIVAATGAVRAVIMVVMVMIVVVVVMVVIVIMVVVTAMLMIVMIVVVMVVIMMIMVMLLHQMLHLLFHDQILMFHSCQDLLAFQLIPRSRDDRSLRILLTQHSHTCIQLVLRHFLGTTDHNRSCVLYLVVKELAKVLHIHLAFLTVYNSHRAVQFYLLMCSHTHNSFGHVGQLANA